MPVNKKKKKRTNKTEKLVRKVARLENDFAQIMRSLQNNSQPIVKSKPHNTYLATVSFLPTAASPRRKSTGSPAPSTCRWRIPPAWTARSAPCSRWPTSRR